MPTTHRNHDLLPGTSFPSNHFPAHSAGKSPRFLCMASQQPTHPKKKKLEMTKPTFQPNLAILIATTKYTYFSFFCLSSFFLSFSCSVCMHACCLHTRVLLERRYILVATTAMLRGDNRGSNKVTNLHTLPQPPPPPPPLL